MRAWDLLVLLGCLVALFLSFPSMQSYKLQPVWELPMDAAAAYRNGHTPEEWEKLPPVVATDLDGDGRQDMVYVTADYKVRVVDGWALAGVTEETPDGRHDSHSSATAALHLREPEAAFEASLLPKLALKFGRRPVALETGYLDPEDDEDGGRRQVIVVLTEGWIVMCFSSSLELLWESHAIEEPEPLAYFKEVSIVIDSTPVQNGDRGLVVIAGRMAAKDKEPEAGHEHFDKEEFAALESDLLKELRGDGLAELDPERKAELTARLQEARMEQRMLMAEKQRSVEVQEHFSYFAFEGHSGEKRWEHVYSDYAENTPFGRKEAERKVLAAIDEDDVGVRNHLIRNMRHIGQVEWFVFADDMLTELPHGWHGREYTKLSAGHFSRDRSSGGVPDAAGWDDDEDDIFGGRSTSNVISGSNVIGSYYAPQPPTQRKPPANVVIAHNADGIEILHYYTGRPLTGLSLPSGSTFADINGDELVDRLDVIPSLHSPEGKKKCIALARTGVPSTEVIFEQTLCEDDKRSKRRNKLKLGKDVIDLQGDVHMLPPVVVAKDRFTANLVYLMSNGRVVCLSETGDQLWTTETALNWRNPANSGKQQGRNFVLKGSHPSLAIIPRHDGTPSHHLLAVGANAIAVISAKTGAVEFTSALPAMPIGPAVFADWDLDGASDFLLPTGAAHIAFRVEPTTPGQMLYPAAILMLILVVLLVACITSGTRKKSNRAKFGI
mmetsp:Transcript_7584/g.32073  ORF Transcript_7584/g.32073 Transcript_7584/m.32073 type:complete len:723 (+) Transcript_7584:51-2219(+)